MSTYELHIDSSSAEAGAERIEKSFDKIKAAASRMEGGVVESAKKMVAAFSQLSNVRTVSREAIDSINSLSTALNKYRGPNKASIDNTASFLSMLRSNAGVRAPSAAGLDRFLQALNKFTGPTPNAGKSTASLLQALAGFTGISGAGARVNAFLTAISGFRGPHATAGKNVQSLFAALNGFTGLPRGFASAATQFINFAAAIDRATAAFRELRAVSGARIPPPPVPPTPGAGAGAAAGGGGAAIGRATAGIRAQSNAVRDLGNNHNFLATSIFRTSTAFNALGGILAARTIITAANDVLKIQSQLEAGTGSIQQARIQFAYLNETTNRLGLDLVSTSRAYGLFLGSVKGTNVSIAEAQKIFQGFATAGRALQLSTGDMDGVFRALGQIISKGKLQAEELRGQLGDRLPGAFIRMANALGLLPSELDAAMKKGEISGKRLEDALLKMANSLENEFAGAAVKASKTVDAAFNRTRNAFVLTADGLGKSGLNQGLINISDALTKFIQSDALANSLNVIGLGFKFLGDNINLVGTILGATAVAASARWITSAVAGALATRKNGESVGYLSNLLRVYREASGASTAAAVQHALAERGLAVDMANSATATNAAATANRNYAFSVTQATAASSLAANAVTQAGNALRAVTINGAAATGTVSTVVSSVNGVAGAARNAANGVTTFGTSMSGVSAAAGAVTRGVNATSSTLAANAAVIGQAGNAFGTYTAGANSAARAAGAAATSGGIVTSSLNAQGAAAAGVTSRLGGLSGALGGAATAASGTASGLGAVAGSTSALTNGMVGAGAAANGFGIAAKGAATGTSVLVGATRESAAAAAAQAAATGTATVATGFLSGAVAVLRSALITLPFFAIVAGLTLLFSWISSVKSESEKAAEAFGSVASAQAEAQNYADAYARRVEVLTGKLDAQAISLRNTEIATINLKNAQAGKIDTGLQARSFKKGDLIGRRTVGQREETVYGSGPNGGVSVSRRMVDVKRDVRANNDGTVYTFQGRIVGKEVAKALAAITQNDGKGDLRLRTDYNDARSYRNATLAQSYLSRRGDLSPDLQARVADAGTVLTRVRQKSAAGDKGLGFSTQKEDMRLFGYDPNNPKGDSVVPTGAGGGGGESEEAKKARKAAEAAAKRAATAAATAGRQDEADLRRALEGVRDVRREVTGAYDAIQAFSRSSEAGIAEAARAVAVSKLDNIEDSYATVERAQAGVSKLTGQLREQAQGTVTALNNAQSLIDKAASGGTVDVDALSDAKRLVASTTQAEADAARDLLAAHVTTYRGSRKAAEDFLGAQERIRVARNKEVELAAKLRESNDDVLRQTGGGTDVKGVDLVAATVRGGRDLKEAQFSAEAMKEAVGVSAENMARFVDELIRGKRAQDNLNTSLEDAREISANMMAARNAQDTAKLYTMGLKPEDLDMYKELIEYRNLLISQGRAASNVDFMVGQRRSALELTRTMGQLASEYEKVRQVGQDSADAIVDGFRKGADEGLSFKKTFKNIFKELQDIILNFVLYNPLKSFLSDLFTGGASGGAGGVGTKSLAGRAGTQAAAGLDVGSMLSSFGDATSYFGGGDGAKGGRNVNRPLNLGSAGINIPQLIPAITSGITSGLSSGLQDTSGTGTGSGAGESSSDIVVSALKSFESAKPVEVSETKGNGRFEALKKVFDNKANFQNLKTGFGEMTGAFNKTKGLTANLKSFGTGLGKVASAAGAAFAAYSTGKTIAKSLGIKGAGAEAIGGAAAGFSIGGPVGAVVGGALGLAKGVLFKKTPRASASISVGDSGRATAGAATSKDGGNKEGVTAAAKAGSSLFNQFAEQFDSYLKAGNYGTFGEAKIKGDDNNKFYSVTGRVDKKGRPIGVRGVDYLNTNDEDELQAFALRKQISSGKFGDLDPIYQKIASASSATSTADLNSDLNVGKNYLAFVEAGKQQSELARNVTQLGKSYNSLTRQSRALGLATDDLTTSYNTQMKRLKDDFNRSISQGILAIEDPIMAEFNDLLKAYRDSVSDAVAVGGDLVQVEKLYGLQRLELMKKYQQDANNNIRAAFTDLVTQLTATSNSPLNAETVLRNSRDNFTDLQAQFGRGDYTNIGKLNDTATNYLNAAQGVFASSTDYFSIFGQVTEYLKTMAATAAVRSGTAPEDLPGLPSVDSLVNELKNGNAASVDATKQVGQAVTEGSAETNELLNQVVSTNKQMIEVLGQRFAVNTSLYGDGRTLNTISSVTQ